MILTMRGVSLLILVMAVVVQPSVSRPQRPRNTARGVGENAESSHIVSAQISRVHPQVSQIRPQRQVSLPVLLNNNHNEVDALPRPDSGQQRGGGDTTRRFPARGSRRRNSRKRFQQEPSVQVIGPVKSDVAFTIRNGQVSAHSTVAPQVSPHVTPRTGSLQNTASLQNSSSVSTAALRTRQPLDSATHQNFPSVSTVPPLKKQPFDTASLQNSPIVSTSTPRTRHPFDSATRQNVQSLSTGAPDRRQTINSAVLQNSPSVFTVTPPTKQVVSPLPLRNFPVPSTVVPRIRISLDTAPFKNSPSASVVTPHARLLQNTEALHKSPLPSAVTPAPVSFRNSVSGSNSPIPSLVTPRPKLSQSTAASFQRSSLISVVTPGPVSLENAEPLHASASVTVLTPDVSVDISGSGKNDKDLTLPGVKSRGNSGIDLITVLKDQPDHSFGTKVSAAAKTEAKSFPLPKLVDDTGNIQPREIAGYRINVPTFPLSNVNTKIINDDTITNIGQLKQAASDRTLFSATNDRRNTNNPLNKVFATVNSITNIGKPGSSGGGDSRQIQDILSALVNKGNSRPNHGNTPSGKTFFGAGDPLKDIVNSLLSGIGGGGGGGGGGGDKNIFGVLDFLNVLGSAGNTVGSLVQRTSTGLDEIARDSASSLRLVGDEIQFKGETAVDDIIHKLRQAGTTAGIVGHNTYRGALQGKSAVDKLVAGTSDNVGNFATTAVDTNFDYLLNTASIFGRFLRDLKVTLITALIQKGEALKELVGDQYETTGEALSDVTSVAKEVSKDNIEALTALAKPRQSG